MDIPCKVCAQATAGFGRHVVLGRHDGVYRRCGGCGYVFVVSPHWLDEAYSAAITALDTGIVERNLWLADATAALLGTVLRGVGPALDYGGGSGLLVRLMRDRGHDFHWYDAHAHNQLARGFEGALDRRYDLLTAFELVEHLEEPVATFEAFARLAPVLLVSTELLPDPAPAPGTWWYYAPEAGQHIGFFTRRSLQVLAERLSLTLSSNGRNLHVFAPQPVSAALLGMLRKPRGARLLAPLGRRRSLARTDAAAALARLDTSR